MKKRLPCWLLIAAVIGLTSCSPGPGLISFPTEDGGIVYADVYGSGEQVVVLAHGGRFTKESWTDQAEIIANAGFRVIAIDFRGRGRSRGGPGSEDSEEGVRFDVSGAVDYAYETGAQSVSVVGASFGGWAAALAAARNPGSIDRLVLLASPVDEPEKLTGRKLFILTREDNLGEHTLRLPEIREQFERAPEPKELILLDGNTHAQFIFDTGQGPRLMNEIIRFLTAE